VVYSSAIIHGCFTHEDYYIVLIKYIVTLSTHFNYMAQFIIILNFNNTLTADSTSQTRTLYYSIIVTLGLL